ncbi:MAG: DnaJ C-terminal domain-containing protein [Candidatus Hodgkinia cicadicola]
MIENMYNRLSGSSIKFKSFNSYTKLHPTEGISNENNNSDKYELQRMNRINEHNFVINPLDDLRNSSPLNDKIGKFRGRNVTLICDVSLEQIYTGGSINIAFECEVKCGQCNLERIGMENCKLCKGNGRLIGKRQIQLSIPTGISDGDIIKFKALGEAGLKGGITGDLYIKFIPNSHEFYTKHQGNIYCRIPVSIETLTNGGRIDITLPRGTKVTLRILPSNNCYYEMLCTNFGLSEITGYTENLIIKFELFSINENYNLSPNLFLDINKFTQILLKQSLAHYDNGN